MIKLVMIIKIHKYIDKIIIIVMIMINYNDENNNKNYRAKQSGIHAITFFFCYLYLAIANNLCYGHFIFLYRILITTKALLWYYAFLLTCRNCDDDQRFGKTDLPDQNQAYHCYHGGDYENTDANDFLQNVRALLMAITTPRKIVE